MAIDDKCILLVDADEDLSGALQLLFDHQGYCLTVARSSAEALRRAGSEHFDLFILSSRMPDGTGLELCRQIRAHDHDTPIVFYSAAAYAAGKQSGLANGAQAYLVKPAVFDKLLRTVSQLMAISH